MCYKVYVWQSILHPWIWCSRRVLSNDPHWNSCWLRVLQFRLPPWDMSSFWSLWKRAGIRRRVPKFRASCNSMHRRRRTPILSEILCFDLVWMIVEVMVSLHTMLLRHHMCDSQCKAFIYLRQSFQLILYQLLWTLMSVISSLDHYSRLHNSLTGRKFIFRSFYYNSIYKWTPESVLLKSDFCE